MKWEQGCYTLVQDTDTEGLQFALDLVLYVGCQSEKVGAGMLHIIDTDGLEFARDLVLLSCMLAVNMSCCFILEEADLSELCPQPKGRGTYCFWCRSRWCR